MAPASHHSWPADRVRRAAHVCMSVRMDRPLLAEARGGRGGAQRAEVPARAPPGRTRRTEPRGVEGRRGAPAGRRGVPGRAAGADPVLAAVCATGHGRQRSPRPIPGVRGEKS
ncbi:DUF6214 family protein [Streptomyces fagopyri]|uniref:DUF6214 family protein n=1 Tax=Streptomyces fagopyri TaxID=2662397 RepID=UPI003711A3E7